MPQLEAGFSYVGISLYVLSEFCAKQYQLYEDNDVPTFWFLLYTASHYTP